MLIALYAQRHFRVNRGGLIVGGINHRGKEITIWRTSGSHSRTTIARDNGIKSRGMHRARKIRAVDVPATCRADGSEIERIGESGHIINRRIDRRRAARRIEKAAAKTAAPATSGKLFRLFLLALSSPRVPALAIPRGYARVHGERAHARVHARTYALCGFLLSRSLNNLRRRRRRCRRRHRRRCRCRTYTGE